MDELVRRFPRCLISKPFESPWSEGGQPLGVTEARILGSLLLEVSLDGEDLGAKWGIDIHGLARKLNELSFPAGVAVLDAIDRFWGNPNSGEALTCAERIQELGIPTLEEVAEV